MKTLTKTADALDAFIDWSGRLTSWLVLALVLLIAVQVGLRYTVNLGAVWAQELEWHLLAVISLWGLAYTQKHDAHVRVDILYQSFRERTRQWIELFSAAFVMAPLAFYFAWLSLRFVMQSYGTGEISADPGGLTHRWILKTFLISGFVLLGIQSIALALRNAALVFNRGKGADDAAE